MAYPINYDFGNKWDSEIKPFLDNPKIKKAIKQGVNDYLEMFPLCQIAIKQGVNDHLEMFLLCQNTYKPNTIPAAYSSKNGYCMLMDRKQHELFKGLHKLNLLPRKFYEFEKGMDQWDIDDYGYEHMVRQFKILDSYFTYDVIKYDLESYHMSGSHHFYAPTFELTLAKLVEPEEKWRVQGGSKHTTVINEDDTKVFDLLHWGDAGRMENYVFGDPIKNIDPTLGGKAAYSAARALS